MARALSRCFTPGENILRATFLEPEMRMLYRDWDRFTTRIVPFLRAVLGAEPPDRELVELVGELSIASKRFATLWARHDVKHRSSGPTEFYHPQVGPLDLHYTILHLPDQRQMIITYHADPVHHPSRISVRSPAWQAKRRGRRDWSRMLLVEHEHDFALPTGVALAEA
jgi:hypothetical protein